MKPLRTLSPSVIEAQLRQNVKRTSSNKRRTQKLAQTRSVIGKENISVVYSEQNCEESSENFNYLIGNSSQLSCFSKKINYNLCENNDSNQNLDVYNANFKKQLLRENTSEQNINYLDTIQLNSNLVFDNSNTHKHTKLRRLSYGNDNLNVINHQLNLLSPNKRRRLSLPHNVSCDNANSSAKDQLYQNNGNTILPLNSKNLQLIQESLDSQDNFHKPRHLNTPKEYDPDVTTVWCKYLNHKKLEKMDSGGSNSTLSSMSFDTSLSRTDSLPISTTSSERNPGEDRSISDQSQPSSKSLRVRQFQTKVRNSFKGLQRMSSFSKSKLPITRSKSDAPQGIKSSFKSYIFSESLTNSPSSISNSSMAAAVPHHRPLGPSSSLYTNVRPTLHDIFNNHPEIADQFAIMIPRDPRPEWHKSLKFVIQKSALKLIGKPPETHETSIPEHLKYQLKQIYVY